MATIDILPLPEAVIPIETQLELSFGAMDLDPQVLEDERQQLLAQMAVQNKAYCSKQPWWSCNTSDTQGACHLSAETTCVPVGSESKPMSYFEQWLLVYGPFYKNMIEKTPSKRSLSVERNPSTITKQTVKLTPPPNPTKKQTDQLTNSFSP